MRQAIILFFLIFHSQTFAQEKKKNVKKTHKKNLFHKDSLIKAPLELRDPFKEKRAKRKGINRTYKTLLVNNSYSNIPNIGNQPLNSIKIVGILLGKKRIAMADVQKQIYALREGMKIGEEQAEIKAILPGGIVVVEKIRNIYNQEEYIETIIPLSSNSRP